MVTKDQAETVAPRRLAATNLLLLRDQIGEIRQKDGKDFHDGAQVIRWLNHVILEENWSQRVIDHGRDEDSDELWALVELTVRIWIDDGEGGLEERVVVKQDFGAQRIKRARATNLPLSIGDERKAALTDGLKRCARLLGIGLYLWDKPSEWELPHERDEEADAQRARQLAQRPAQAPAAAPAANPAPVARTAPARAQTAPVAVLDPSERAAQENKYDQLTCTVQELGMQASWVGTHHSKWTDAQLPRYIGLLEQFIQRNQTNQRTRGAA